MRIHGNKERAIANLSAAEKPEAVEVGSYAWLAENDAFNTSAKVLVLKILKAGNCQVFDFVDKRIRECHVKNLSAYELRAKGDAPTGGKGQP